MEPRKNMENVMKHFNKAIFAAAVLLMTAPAAAQNDSSAENQYDRARGELSPGTTAPSQARLMQVIESGSPERLATLLEYGELVQCHACVPLLERRLLEDNNALVREMSAWWLRRRPFGFAAVFHDIRTALATDADPVRRARAAEALGEFMDPHGVTYLREAINNDTDARVRAAAVAGLGRINSPAGNEGIVEAFSDSDATVREAAVGQVLYVNLFRDHDALMGLLADENVDVRRRAALALGTFRVTEASPALVGMLSDAAPMARQAAAWALGRIGGGEARAALTAQQSVEDTSYVRDAIDIALRM
ncbi:MAG: HEAT repeat domain-containing protein [Sandaracinaceae bacterium]|nr:HEAT repeat domain-containing protein [Sandaracinaceae bacterium]